MSVALVITEYSADSSPPSGPCHQQAVVGLNKAPCWKLMSTIGTSPICHDPSNHALFVFFRRSVVKFLQEHLRYAYNDPSQLLVRLSLRCHVDMFLLARPKSNLLLSDPSTGEQTTGIYPNDQQQFRSIVLVLFYWISLTRKFTEVSHSTVPILYASLPFAVILTAPIVLSSTIRKDDEPL